VSAADGPLALAEAREETETQRHLPVIEESRRGRPGTRGRTLSMRRQSKRELARLAELYPDAGEQRPETRGECMDDDGPCPFVGCKHHLYLDVNEHNGNIKLNFPDVEVEAMPETCALRVADRGGVSLEEIGAIMNLTRERVRQIESIAIARLKAVAASHPIADHLDERSTPLPARSPAPALAEPARLDWFGESSESLDAAPEVEAAWCEFIAAPAANEPVEPAPAATPAAAVLSDDESAELCLARERAASSEITAQRLMRERDHYRDELDAELARVAAERDAMRSQRDAAEAEVARMLRGVSAAHAMKVRLDWMKAQRDEARALVAAAMTEGLAECERLRASPVAPLVLLDEGMLARIVSQATTDATRDILRSLAGGVP
jgi:hypothetical protein